MRSLLVVASAAGGVNRFPQASLMEARNLMDFLEQTGDYYSVSIYELEGSDGPLTHWSEIEAGPA